MVKVAAKELSNYLKSINDSDTLIIIKPIKKIEASKETTYCVITRGRVNGETSLC